MIKRHWLIAMILACNLTLAASLPIEMRVHGTRSDLITRFDGQTIEYEVRWTGSRNVESEWEGVSRADVADLDVSRMSVGTSSDGTPTTAIVCRNQANCIRETGQVFGSLAQPGDWNGTGATSVTQIYCPSRAACDEFIAAVQGKRDEPPPTHRTPQQPVATSQPSQSNVAAADQNGPSARLDAAIARVLKKQQSPQRTLDDLVRQATPKPGMPPKPPRPKQQVVYVAFAEADGFDANGDWGYGKDANLGQAIGRALTECQSTSGKSCGGGAYCAMSGGRWSAWATDGKVPGNLGLVCNLASEVQARDSALSWCGNGCTVHWVGSDQ